MMDEQNTPPAAAPPAVKKESKIKTFFEHLGEFLKDHLGPTASFEHTASVALAVVGPLLNTLITLTAGEKYATKVSGVVAQVQTSLSNTSALLAGAEAGDATHSVAGFLAEINTALPTLLEDADIKNSAKLAEIEAIVNTITGETSAIAAAIPATHSVPVVGSAQAAS